MFIYILLLAVGFVLLIAGAHWLVRGASSLAKRLNVPELVIGLTVVAFGTSTPEMIVNMVSAIQNVADISFGNIIGSNNFNILIILGLSALIYPLDVKKTTTWREIPFALMTSFVLLILVNDAWFVPGALNILTRGDGLILLAFFLIFLIYTHNLAKQGAEVESGLKILPWYLILVLLAAGFAGLILGGNLVVKYAVLLAQKIGISQKVIGLTIVAAGTSLPELATSIVAAWKKKPDIAVGNIVGSNIFNLLFILGVAPLICPLVYQLSFNTDQYLMIFCTFLLFLLMLNPKPHRLDRWEGALMICIYIAYAVFFLK